MDETLTPPTSLPLQATSPSLTLPLARYRFSFRMLERLRLPHYAGSLLRGQFGASLRNISCMTKAPSCDGCPLRSTCPYPAIFEAPAPVPAPQGMQQFSHIPNPYVIEPPPIGATILKPGDSLHFNLVLFGRALDHFPIIILALQRALERGLGSLRARGTLERIDVQNTRSIPDSQWDCVWRHGNDAIAAHETAHELAGEDARTSEFEEATLVFETPLRLQHQGRPIGANELTPRKLVADLLRRITLLAQFHAGQPDLVSNAPALVRRAETIRHMPELHWHDWTRYSSRQKQEMKLGGVMGSWTLSGELGPLLPWLQLGQWLHIGKNATLGLGAYRLITKAADPADKQT